MSATVILSLVTLFAVTATANADDNSWSTTTNTAHEAFFSGNYESAQTLYSSALIKSKEFGRNDPRTGV